MSITMGTFAPELKQWLHRYRAVQLFSPYDATSTDLQTACSDLAPVRSAFVVFGHGSGVSKGVGYVSFP